MQCGHCYCIECIRILVERASFGRRNFSVKCAVCRQSTHQGEISYVMTSKELQPDDIIVKVSFCMDLITSDCYEASITSIIFKEEVQLLLSLCWHHIHWRAKPLI